MLFLGLVGPCYLEISLRVGLRWPPGVVDSERVFTTLSLSEASPSASASVQNPSLTLPLTLTSTPKVGYYPIPVGISSILGAAQSTCCALVERLTQFADHTSTHIICSLPCSRIQTWLTSHVYLSPQQICVSRPYTLTLPLTFTFPIPLPYTSHSNQYKIILCSYLLFIFLQSIQQIQCIAIHDKGGW